MSSFLKKRWPVVLIAIVIALFIGYALIDALVASIINGKIQDAVASHLRADLQYDSISYRFPYTVHLGHVQMFSKQADDHVLLLAIDRLDLTLAELPRAGKPIVVKNLDLIAPTFHLIKTPTGVVGRTDLATNAAQPSNNAPPHKLSEMFELRRFKITGGQIAYEDHSEPTRPSMSFSGIDADLGVTPKSKALYSYHVTINGSGQANVDASGTMDIDQLLLDIDQFTTRANASIAGGKSGLPPQVQKVISDAGITGSIELAGKATLPLRDIQRAQYSFTTALHNGGAKLATTSINLSGLEILADLNGSGSQATLHLAKLEATSDGTSLTVNPFSAQSRNGILALSHVKATFRNDQWILNAAQIVRDPSDNHLAINGINGQIIFATPRAIYPAVVGRAFKQFSPVGAYSYSGSADFHRVPSTQPTVDLAIQTNGTSATVTSHNIAMTNIVGDLRLTNTALQIKRIEGNALDGKIVAQGMAVMVGQHGYQGEFVADSIDLDQFAQAFAIPQSDHGKLTGRANVTIKFEGRAARDALTTHSTFAADGRLEISGGQLWELPLLDKIADATGVKRDVLVASNAAAVFHIEDEVVRLRHAAISSPVLGLQGSGMIGFNKTLDLDVIAAPLGDWKEHLKSTNIPIVSDVAGELAGGIQKLIGAATKKLLYEFHVTGLMGDPQINAIPAPVLTKNVAEVFGKMLREIKASELLDAMDNP